MNRWLQKQAALLHVWSSWELFWDILHEIRVNEFSYNGIPKHVMPSWKFEEVTKYSKIISKKFRNLLTSELANKTWIEYLFSGINFIINLLSLNVVHKADEFQGDVGLQMHITSKSWSMVQSFGAEAEIDDEYVKIRFGMILLKRLNREQFFSYIPTNYLIPHNYTVIKFGKYYRPFGFC